MFDSTFCKLSMCALKVVMIECIHISLETFASDMLTAFKAVRVFNNLKFFFPYKADQFLVKQNKFL